MQNLEEFRTGLVSLPVGDTDDLPPCCFACPYLFGKEFSVGEGPTHLCCSYHAAARTAGDARPACVGG